MTQLTAPREAPGRTSAVLPIVAVGVLLSGFDLFIVNVALDSIGTDLAVRELGSLSWVLNAHGVAYAALLVPEIGITRTIRWRRHDKP